MPNTTPNPALEEWMKLYEAPFRFSHQSVYDVQSRFVCKIGTAYTKVAMDAALGAFIAEQLNELFELNKENVK